jgi:hypothetical protein
LLLVFFLLVIITTTFGLVVDSFNLFWVALP